MFTMEKQETGFDELPARDKACIELKRVFQAATGRVPDGIDAFVDYLIEASLYALDERVMAVAEIGLINDVRIIYTEGEDEQTGETAAGDAPLLEEMAQGAEGEAGAEQLQEGADLGGGLPATDTLQSSGDSITDADEFTTEEGMDSTTRWGA